MKKIITLSADTIKAIRIAINSTRQSEILQKAIAAQEAKHAKEQIEKAVNADPTNQVVTKTLEITISQELQISVVDTKKVETKANIIDVTQAKILPLKKEVQKQYVSRKVPEGAEARTDKKREAMIVFLSDINNDGLSEAGKENWYVGEAMLREELLTLTDEKFDSFISRLGLEIGEYQKNPKDFKSKFVDALGMRLVSGIPLTQIISEKEGKFLDRKAKLERDYVKSIMTPQEQKELDEAVLTNEKVREILKNLPPGANEKKFLNTVRLEAIGVLVGSAQGVGVSVNIKEATHNWLDNLQVGIINGVPGIGISKNLYTSENKKTSLT